MVVDFKVPMRDRKGNIARDGEREIILSDPLCEALDKQSGKITSRKAVGWSRAMARGEPLTLDDADFQDLYSWIQNKEEFFNIFKENLLDVMDTAKAKKEGTK